MYGNPYTMYNPQSSIDRINSQIAELEKMKSQIPMQPTNLTQNFQLAPTKDIMKFANNIDEVQKDMVVGDTPYFSKDMSIVWIKSVNGDIKTYELTEIIQKDEKDLIIESLQMQLKEIKGEISNAKSNDDDVDKSVESKKSSSISTNRTIKTK